MVEETGLELTAMNGFPGPLVRWMLDAIGPTGIAETAAGLDDCRAVARCQLLVVADGETLFAEGSTDGTLVLPARGESGFGWDSVFQPNGSDLTYAELAREAKDEVGHRGRAWRNLLQLLGA